MIAFEQVEEIALPFGHYGQLIEHAKRKLGAHYLPGEEPERKAYGLLGARLSARQAEVTHVVPLQRNLRYESRHRLWMDDLMGELAVRSETPLKRRGWVADPGEVMRAERECDGAGSALFATYHMHRVPWEHDPVRDTPTEIDARLAQGCGLWVVVLSMVDPERPRLRAFFEADKGNEATLTVVPAEPRDMHANADARNVPRAGIRDGG